MATMDQQKTTPHWYALKVFYNRVFPMENLLRQREIESYVPVKQVEQVRNGVKYRKRLPAVASLLFMRCTSDQAEAIRAELRGRAMVYCDPESRKPTAIPDPEMQRFIFITSKEGEELEYFGEQPADWFVGERVRVTEGPLCGAEGRIKRIRGDHRLVVCIEGVVAVATTYIPGCFHEKIEE